MIQDPKTYADGQLSFLGGQDAGRQSFLLSENQASELWNYTVRGGSLKTRPGFNRLTLTFQTDEIEDWFTTQLVQGAIVFKSRNGQVRQVWSVGGRFFTVDAQNSYLVQEITPQLNTVTTANFTVPAVGSSVSITILETVDTQAPIRVGYPIQINGKSYIVTAVSGATITATNVDDTPAALVTSGAAVVYLDPNADDIGICYMVIAEDFLIAQDGFSKPLIFDGSISRRSNTISNEVPVGTVMAYGIGRLWVNTGYRTNQFVASDIVYGPTGTDDYGKRDAILKFTENSFLAGGGFFTAPGIITAMQFASSLDTSTGQGPLMVMTEDAICSVNAPTAREAWAVVTDPIQTISLRTSGATSFYGTVTVANGDIFYRSQLGLNSFFVARREFGTWGNTPISGEMQNVIQDDAPELMLYSSAIVFDNRLLFTVSPRPDGNGAYWKGIGVLDFDTMSTMFDKSSPVYDGTWTGVDPQWLFTGKYGRTQRAFMAVRGDDGLNQLWEISQKDQFDNGDGRIKSKLITRSFSFQNPLEMVRLSNLELFISNVIGDVDVTVRYRPDEYPCWFSWKAQAVCANWRKCDGWQNCETPIAFRNGYKTRIGFGQPPDEDETNDGKPARCGYVHQVSLETEGHVEIQKLRLRAIQVVEEHDPRVDMPEGCQEINCCPDNPYSWRSADATDAGGQS